MATAASASVLTAGSRPPAEYWHLLSLDAPTVAVLWACLLCNATQVAAPVPSVLVLGLGTWLIYAADRILDGIRPLDLAQLKERHYFHQANRKAFGVAGIGVLAALAVLAARYLPVRTLAIFSAVLFAAVGYFVVVHCGSAAIQRLFPKELAVGTVFAAAVAVPAWSCLPAALPRGHLLSAVSLLAALCWLNCIAIESWESGPSRNRPAIDRTEASGVFRIWRGRSSSPHIVRRVAAGVAIAAVVALGTSLRSGAGLTLSPIHCGILMSAMILFYLDLRRDTLSPLRLRIAADLALLTPLPFLMVAPLQLLARLLMSPGVR